MLRQILTALGAMALFATPALAQQTAPAASSAQTALRVAPSGRATTTVTLTPPRVQGQPAPAARTIRIDYGQPHARGRQIVGQVVPMDSVWRTGANEATTLTTDVDLVIGGAAVPSGSYTLFTLPTREGWTLIINRKTGQWGTQYDAAQDLARVKLRARTLRDPVESLAITLVPGRGTPAGGELTIAWGTVHLATDWTVAGR